MLNKFILALVAAVSCTLATCESFAKPADLLIADFEGTNYGEWTVRGTAFGPGPARGTLPNQMAVDGFRGNGLVNSFYGGDASTGTLTSASITIERRYIKFLIGGGGWKGRTCMNLVVDGKTVRSATGPNTRSGGSEHLDPQVWDVGEFDGKGAKIEIVDNATEGWGHITVDEIVQTDVRPSGVVAYKDVTKDFVASKKYLNFAVRKGAPKRHLKILEGEQVLDDFEIELATENVEWWAFFDLERYRGRRLRVVGEEMPENSTALDAIDQTDSIKGSVDLYRESRRPQFHFTSRRGWLNDPNGVVFYDGEYHLFYQHNPYGWDWGNMHWGHAVSTDLVHWRELPMALYPDRLGTMFSGSAVVDWNNTSGFRSGTKPPLVAMFTDAGEPFTQGLAYSNDKGRTWTKYDGNPVLKHIVGGNRDPKVVWFAPEKKWVTALYLDGHDYRLFSSRDLKSWETLCDVKLPGDAECPEFFEIGIEGSKERRWVFYGASGKYLVGSFDGKNFKAETGPLDLQQGNAWYASQTYNDIPAKDGRRILIPWGRMDGMTSFGGMTFNQMMGLPVALTLRRTDAGPRLRAYPVRELASLHGKHHHLGARELKRGENPLAKIKVELLDFNAEIGLGNADSINLKLRGISITYEAKKQQINCGGRTAKLSAVNGKLKLRILVDRLSVDIFGNDGELYMPIGLVVPESDKSLDICSTGDGAVIESLDVYEMKSSWN